MSNDTDDNIHELKYTQLKMEVFRVQYELLLKSISLVRFGAGLKKEKKMNIFRKVLLSNQVEFAKRYEFQA